MGPDETGSGHFVRSCAHVMWKSRACDNGRLKLVRMRRLSAILEELRELSKLEQNMEEDPRITDI